MQLIAPVTGVQGRGALGARFRVQGDRVQGQGAGAGCRYMVQGAGAGVQSVVSLGDLLESLPGLPGLTTCLVWPPATSNFHFISA